MAENSKIEWTHHTFNPWWGCTKISPACDNCYAAETSARFGNDLWGNVPRRRTGIQNWNLPRKWNRICEAAGRRDRVFCASMADVFDNQAPQEWRDDLWLLIEETPHLDWLLLTKRPQNIRKMYPAAWLVNPPKNVWLGTTVENQKQAELNIPHLLKIPAAVRFLSCEPLLGPIEFHIDGLWFEDCSCDEDGESSYDPETNVSECGHHGGKTNDVGIDWVITGGESGDGARPAHPDWYRSLRDQCKAAGVPFLFKQWSGRNQSVIKKLGRELDGVIHDGYPRREI